MNNAQMMGYFAGYDTQRTGLSKKAGTPPGLAAKATEKARAKTASDDIDTTPAPKGDTDSKAIAKTTEPKDIGVYASQKPGANVAAAQAQADKKQAASAELNSQLPLAGAGQSVMNGLGKVKDVMMENPMGATAAVAGAAAVPLVLAYLVQSKKAKKKKAIQPNEFSGQMIA